MKILSLMATGAICLLLSGLNTLQVTGTEVSMVKENKYSKLGKYIAPMVRPGKGRYCSASYINYNGTIYAVTNRHCCDVPIAEGMNPEYRVVGDEMLKILHVSQGPDICVLKTRKTKGLRIAKTPPSRFDPNFIIGYPTGNPQTVRSGHYQYSAKACINYSKYFEAPDMRCMPSYFYSTVIRPGSSGSPSFNLFGEVIGIVYAGGDILSISTTLKQLKNTLRIAEAVNAKDK